MFERPHHRDVALILQSLDADALEARGCFFGGGTAMALRYGEYRESVDIDFLVSSLDGYRELRQRLGVDLAPITRAGMTLRLDREIRTDQYGIRTRVRSGAASIKFEIVLEGRIELAMPAERDRICGVLALTELDLACEKLLANADRWRDDSVFSRDLIDLAMQRAPTALLRAACDKAETAYGKSVRRAVASAVELLRRRPDRLGECMNALAIDTVTRAQLWQAIRRLARILAARD